ncbi:MAG: S8 family serine peptidase [bacterium]
MRIQSLVVALASMLACVDSRTPISTAPVGATPLASLASTTSPAAGTPISGEYIVRFHDAEPDVDARIRALRGRIDGSIDGTYRRAIKGVFVRRLSDRAVAVLRADPSVVSVEQNMTVVGAATQSNAPWGIDRLDQRNRPLSTTYTYGPTGSGVTAYIIDSGINFSHVEFGGRASLGVDIVSPSNGGVDCSGHGTLISGIAGGATYGVAKNVRLVAVRVLDCATRGNTAGFIAGIDWVTTHRVLPAVANLSVGTPYSATLNAAVRNSIASGVVYTIASGNSNVDACTSSPSSTVEAITVAATDIYDEWANFSNNGPCVDLAAPGVSITSATIGSPTATQSVYGTSFSAPHVAGAAALYLQLHPTDTPAQVQAALTSNATIGVLSIVPAGSPNKLLYTGFMTGSTPPPPPTNQPPVARFSVSCPTTQCTFDASGSTDDIGIVRYDWNWGNGKAESHSAPTAKNTFATGTYDVTLIVTDGVGAKGSLTKTITVGSPPPPPPSNQPPVASIVSPANGTSVAVGTAVSFTGSATDPEDGTLSGASLAWTSSIDGSLGTGNSISRSTLSVGTHSITLKATDSKGGSSSTAVTLTVSAAPPPPPPPPGNQPPTAAFSWSCTGQAYPHQCAFDASASRDDVGIVAYTWDWGNGRSESKVGTTARNSWTASGSYTVTLTVRDGRGASGSVAKTVIVP